MREGLSITLKSIAVLVGLGLVTLGGVEIGVAITDEGGTYARGFTALALGLAIAIPPLVLAFRDMLNEARREGRLPPKKA